MTVQAPTSGELRRAVDVFISYRRAEASYSAGWLHDHLASHLGRDRVFLDMDALRPGVDFMQAIHSAIVQAKVMLVMIGPQWLTGPAGDPRLADPADPVRLEIEAALRAELLIVPLLLDGATMPSPAQLPPTMARLAALNAVPVRRETFVQVLDEVLHLLSEVIPDVAEREAPTGPLPPATRVRSGRADEIDPDGELRSRLLGKSDQVYSAFLRQAVQDDGVVEMPLNWRRTPERVRRRADALLPDGVGSDRPVADGSSLTTLLDAAGGLDGDGLLVLGEPGAGKSTALIELARSLVERARRDVTHPVPIYLPLRTWGGRRTSVTEWATQQLGQLYEIPGALAERWIREGELLLLLDGLDDIHRRDARTACVVEINRFRLFGSERRLPVVVTSRPYEYDTQPERLEFDDAVVVLPLDPDDVERRLAAAGPRMQGVLTALHEDDGARSMATSPLLLSLITRTCAERVDRAAVLPGLDAVERRRGLFADYVDRRFEWERRMRPGYGNRYRPEATRSWLYRLATMMNDHEETVFDLGRLHAGWLDRSAQRWAVTVLPGLLFAPIFALVAMIVNGPQAALQGCLVALIGAAVTARMLPVFRSTEPWSWSWSWAEARTRLPTTFLAALAVALMLGVIEAGVPAAPGAGALALPQHLERALERTVAATVALVGIRGVVCRPDHARGRSPARPEATWAVSAALAFALAFGAARAVTSGASAGGVVALAWTAVVGISAWLVGTSAPTEAISWSWGSAVRRLRWTVVAAIGVGSVVFASHGLYAGVPSGLSAGAVFGAGAAVATFLIKGVSRIEIPVQVTPNQATRRSLRSGLLAAAAAFSVFGTAVGGVTWMVTQNVVSAVQVTAAFGLPVAGVVALAYGLGAVAQHWLIRFLLWKNGVGPFRYARWLDYVVTLKFLYRNGIGGYVFMHGLIRDHFAQREGRP